MRQSISSFFSMFKRGPKKATQIPTNNKSRSPSRNDLQSRNNISISKDYSQQPLNNIIGEPAKMANLEKIIDIYANPYRRTPSEERPSIPKSRTSLNTPHIHGITLKPNLKKRYGEKNRFPLNKVKPHRPKSPRPNNSSNNKRHARVTATRKEQLEQLKQTRKNKLAKNNEQLKQTRKNKQTQITNFIKKKRDQLKEKRLEEKRLEETRLIERAQSQSLINEKTKQSKALFEQKQKQKQLLLASRTPISGSIM